MALEPRNKKSSLVNSMGDCVSMFINIRTGELEINLPYNYTFDELLQNMSAMCALATMVRLSNSMEDMESRFEFDNLKWLLTDENGVKFIKQAQQANINSAIEEGVIDEEKAEQIVESLNVKLAVARKLAEILFSEANEEKESKMTKVGYKSDSFDEKIH